MGGGEASEEMLVREQERRPRGCLAWTGARSHLSFPTDGSLRVAQFLPLLFSYLGWLFIYLCIHFVSLLYNSFILCG